MSTERPTLDERLTNAGIGPHQRESAGVSVVLCELVDELVMATREQSTLLRAVMVRITANHAGQTRGAGQSAGAAAPSGPAEGDDQGGAQVQLREPMVPPPDPDPEPAGGTDRPVAEPPATAAARRKPTAKAAPAKKAAAKTTTATREGRTQ